MSIGSDIAREGIVPLEEFHGDTYVLARTGNRFVAVIETAPPVDPEFALGSDLREKSILHVSNDPGILLGDRISPADDATVIWKVTKRERNPADVSTMFWVINETDQDTT